MKPLFNCSSLLHFRVGQPSGLLAKSAHTSHIVRGEDQSKMLTAFARHKSIQTLTHATHDTQKVSKIQLPQISFDF